MLLFNIVEDILEVLAVNVVNVALVDRVVVLMEEEVLMTVDRVAAI